LTECQNKTAKNYLKVKKSPSNDSLRDF